MSSDFNFKKYYESYLKQEELNKEFAKNVKKVFGKLFNPKDITVSLSVDYFYVTVNPSSVRPLTQDLFKEIDENIPFHFTLKDNVFTFYFNKESSL